MREYDTFNPTIPDTDVLPVYDSLPPYEEAEKETVVNNKGRQKAQTERKPRAAAKPKKQEAKAETFNIEKVKALVNGQTLRWVLGMFLGFLAVYIGVAFLSYFSSCVVDQSEISNTAVGEATHITNKAGEGGARLSEFLINECFGLGSIVIVVWLFAMAMKQLIGKPRFKSVNFTIKCIVALITLSLIVGLVTIGLDSPVNWGGYHGRYVNEFVIHFIGWTGAVLLCLFMVGCFVAICMRDFIKWILKIKHQRAEARRIKEEERAERLAREREIMEMRLREDKGESLTGEGESEGTGSGAEGAEQMSFEDAESGIYTNLPDFDETEYSSYNVESDDRKTNSEEVESHSEGYVHSESEEVVKSESSVSQEYHDDLNNHGEDVQNSGNEEKSGDFASSVQDSITSTDELTENGESEEPEMVVNVNTISQVNGFKRDADSAIATTHRYKFPPVEILKKGEVTVNVDSTEQLENKEKIKRTLLSFGIPITSIEATIGPTVTLYEIVPEKGVKVARIKSLVDDIALSLAAEGVRIIAPIPGKGTVGIEVANKDPQTVSMRTIICSPTFRDTKYKLPVAIGSTISNEVYIADLAKMPHLLVAGATGQGKSVGLNAIIASLLYSKSPDELKFVMVDPKMVEFSIYSKIEGHYLAKIPDTEDAIITDMDKVVATLSSLCVEMDNRYQLLKEAHARNIIEYNDKIKEKKLNPLEGHRFMPYIVIIVDEFSDLIMTAGKEVEVPIARLAQKARAVGMHVIIATQRPSTNVITGIIKANFPARMAFKVSSGVDSKTILDTPGAQQLIGKGDMLISNSSPMVRVQCAFIDTPEVEELCDYIERQPYAQGAYELPEPVVNGGDGNDSESANIFGERDALFEEVARLVVTSNTASTSSLQRRYSIGYNRAGKIMDQLEAAGIVGPAQGGKPRSVLVDPITLESILNS